MSNTSQALTLSQIDGVALSANPETLKQRDALLAQSQAVRVVFDAQSQQAAVELIRSLKALSKGVEAARAAVKAPVLDLGKRIDALAKEVTVAVDAEEKRLNGLLVAHEAEKRRQAEEAERKRKAEEAERARLAAEKEAEIKRREEEAAKLAAQADPQAKAEAERLAAEAERMALDAELAELEADAVDVVPVAAEPEITGAKAKEDWDYDVVELRSFAMSYPDLVEMKPKRREILEAIKNGTFDRKLDPGMTPVSTECVVDATTVKTAPGLRIYKAIKVTVR